MRLALRHNSRLRLLYQEEHTSSPWLHNLVLTKPTPMGLPIYCALAVSTTPRRTLTRCIITGTFIPMPGRPTSLRFPSPDTVSARIAILSTSLGRYQILWRVVGFPFPQHESALTLRTTVLGRDLDCTAASWILYLQRLPNREYDLAYPFTSNTLAIPLAIPMASGWIFHRPTPCFRLAQSHCENDSMRRQIPNTIGA